MPRRLFRVLILFLSKPVFTMERLMRILKEKLNGIETYNFVAANDLGIPIEFEPVSSCSSGNSYLGKVLKDLNVTNNDSIVDFGCGKGGAILYMDKFPFEKIIGIEYSQSVFLQAKSNIEKMKKKNIQIIHCDAGCYDDLDDINYMYMYNPFGLNVMKRVLDNIYKSYRERPRKIIIIYKNPVFHNEIVSRGIFTKVAEYKTECKFNFFIYSTNIT